MAETIEGLDTLAILHKHAQTYRNCGSSFQNAVSTFTLFAQAAQGFNSECDITASTHCINTLHSGLEIIVEAARGIGIGLENLGNIVLHPIETGKSILNFTKSIAWGLQETARLFDISMKVGRDKNLIGVFGGHANLGGLIKESEMLQFLEVKTPQILNGFYNKNAVIKTPLGTFNSYKTYFPSDWAPKQIVEYILKKLKDAEFITRNDGKIEASVFIGENLKLKYIFNPHLNLLDTVYPYFTSIQ